MEVITNAELDILCQDVVTNAVTYDIPLHPILQLLYNTGLRIEEAIQAERWSPVDADGYDVVLAKSSGVRYIHRYLVPVKCQEIYDNQPDNFYQFRIRQVRYYMKYYTPATNISKGEKETVCHLFRYNYCRKLYDEGYSVADISAIIKHSSPALTSHYIFDPIINNN